MPLVNYSSSEEEDDANKRRKTTKTGKGKAVKSDGKKADDMPPLPSGFHDIYASTVRQSVVDDPSLHQGRKRQTPHVVGKWPSHVYVEWSPSESQHKFMSDFLETVESELGDEIDLHKFLTSDLGAPLPLHISLSRPLSLSTAEKDEFRNQLAETIRSSGVHSFAVSPRDLAWYKSPDSDRTFLVVRVETASKAHETGGANPELLHLLRRCNAVAERFKQPCLYQSTGAECAFHLSVAWTFGLSREDAAMKTLEMARQKHVQDARSWKIDVSAIKVKIGNVITNVDLAGKRRSQDGHFLLGE